MPDRVTITATSIYICCPFLRWRFLLPVGRMDGARGFLSACRTPVESLVQLTLQFTLSASPQSSANLPWTAGRQRNRPRTRNQPQLMGSHTAL